MKELSSKPLQKLAENSPSRLKPEAPFSGNWWSLLEQLPDDAETLADRVIQRLVQNKLLISLDPETQKRALNVLTSDPVFCNLVKELSGS